MCLCYPTVEMGEFNLSPMIILIFSSRFASRLCLFVLFAVYFFFAGILVRWQNVADNFTDIRSAT